MLGNRLTFQENTQQFVIVKIWKGVIFLLKIVTKLTLVNEYILEHHGLKLQRIKKKKENEDLKIACFPHCEVITNSSYYVQKYSQLPAWGKVCYS